ncbi:MAG: NTP transferase domain-containing protein [Anaerolineales bacterium]|nr:NTP transferase domain-containing protein [Anaerolineales bacterium]
MARNLEYQQGQSTSVKTGITAPAPQHGCSRVLLADQPQIPVEVIRALVESHTSERHSVIVPPRSRRNAGQTWFCLTASPSLTCLQLTGDVGGRAIFDKHRVSFLPWHDDILIFDVDKTRRLRTSKNLE